MTRRMLSSGSSTSAWLLVSNDSLFLVGCLWLGSFFRRRLSADPTDTSWPPPPLLYGLLTHAEQTEYRQVKYRRLGDHERLISLSRVAQYFHIGSVVIVPVYRYDNRRFFFGFFLVIVSLTCALEHNIDGCGATGLQSTGRPKFAGLPTCNPCALV